MWCNMENVFFPSLKSVQDSRPVKKQRITHLFTSRSIISFHNTFHNTYRVSPKKCYIAICFCKLPQQPDFNASVRYYDQHSKFWSTRSTWKEELRTILYHWKAFSVILSTLWDFSFSCVWHFSWTCFVQIAACYLNQSWKQLHTLALSLKIRELKIPL